MALNNDDLFLVNQGGESKKITYDNLQKNINENGGNDLQQVTDNGNATTNLIEAGGGVSVTGGNLSADGKYGITKGGDTLSLVADGQAAISAKNSRVVSLGGLDAYGDAIVSIRTVPDDKYTGNLYGVRFNVPDAPNLTGTSNVYGFESRYNATKNLNSFTGFIAQKGSWGAGVGAADLKGFAVENGFSNDAVSAYAFYGNIGDNGDVTNPFNFYAAGAAPNFFNGDTYIGGSPTRNTRQLWESLLTEEQKEELAAGTLAVPANVSTPGDGSFVRQWWYDQQSAEDQALIDAGELDYPELLQPANFVDTFALGDNTNINLNSNGLGEFKGGVKVSGGTRNNVENGFYKNSDNTIGITQVVSNLQRDGGALYGHRMQILDNTISGTPTGFIAYDGILSSGLNIDYTSYISSGSSLSGTVPSYKAFSCAGGGLGNVAKGIGFYGNVVNQAGTERYNFYAEGSAPNYFRGSLTVGLSPTDNPGVGSNTGTQFLASGLSIYGRNSATASDGNLILNRSGSSTGRLIEFKDDGTFADAIVLDGSGGVTFGTSDYRLKENIVDLPSATDAIKSLRPVNFNFKSHPGKIRPGFIAHEVSETLPVAVTGEKDETEAIGTLRDALGNILEENVPEPEAATMAVDEQTWTATGTRPVYQGVDQTKLIPLLTKALQEALEKIDVLETRLAALEGGN